MHTETIQLRPEVLAFVMLMEKRLREKDEDKGQRWKSKDPFDLICDTGLAAHRLRASVTDNNISLTIRHAVDLANFSMFVADVSGALNGGHEVAQRIAVCLDACHGIRTDVLEVTHGLDDIYNDILQRKNDLLAALKGARETLERANTDGHSVISDTIWHTQTETLFDFMDEAIAKAEGKMSFRGLKCDYTGTPPFVNAKWANEPNALCLWCAGTGHPYGDEKYGICECPKPNNSKAEAA